MNIRRYLPVIFLLAAVISAQAIFSLANSDFMLIQLTMSAYYALVIIGLSLLMGYAGQISLGHAAFFAIGGYVAAVMSTYNLAQHADVSLLKSLAEWGAISTYINPYGVQIFHASSWIAFLFAILVTFITSFLIGIPVLKLRGHYLAMATLGFGIIIYRILLGTKIFGEADGISNVMPFKVIADIQVSGDPLYRVQNYYISWFLVLIGMIILLNIVNSRVGRALRSIHGSEEAANAMGVNSSRYKLYVFILSAIFASIGGFFMTHYNGGIGPTEAGIMKSVRYVAIVAVGGLANLWGCLIMGIVLNFLSLRGYFGSYDDAVFGAMLIIIMIFAPKGILKYDVLSLIRRFKSKKDEPA